MTLISTASHHSPEETTGTAKVISEQTSALPEGQAAEFEAQGGEPKAGNCNARQIFRGARDVIITAVISTVLTCLFLLLAALVFGLKESGSAADWLATIFNAIVAITAVAAFIVARSWLPQLTTQEGYKTAIGLVNDQYIQLGDGHLPGVAAEKAVTTFRSLVEAGLHAKLDEYKDNVNYLRIQLDVASQNLESIKSSQFILNTYGLTEAPRYRTTLSNMLASFESSLPLGKKLLELLTSDLTRREAVINKPRLANSPSEETWRKRLSDDGKKIELIYEQYVTAITKIKTAHNTVFRERPSIGEIFVVRKRWGG
ncbi:hypothetical protein SMKC081_23160 [Serratia marcescens]|uniref:hypothetical protein n=1 Tax=Serratia marcescens TaxID=615 RepID=UPI000EFB5156|nr:hypothetical protein [Serratia marcescens]BEN74171.1 hypothetical protein SMKC081_23160 [Serratia marcescens]